VKARLVDRGAFDLPAVSPHIAVGTYLAVDIAPAAGSQSIQVCFLGVCIERLARLVLASIAKVGSRSRIEVL